MEKYKFLGVALAAIVILWMLGPSPEERQRSQDEVRRVMAEEAEKAVVRELPPDPGTPTAFPKERIEIRTQRGALPLIAGIADSPYNRRQGLMHYKSWPQGMHGLLFLFRDQAIISMWMKNTHLPLDILFIDETGKIVHIAENTTPLSETHISSEKPSKAVFEIPAGSAKQWQLNIGDRFSHPYFGLQP